MFPQENFKFKSSKMALNASKTANSDRLMESVIITLALKTNEQTLKLNPTHVMVLSDY